MGGLDVQLHSFWTSKLCGRELSTSSHSRFYHQGGWVSPKRRSWPFRKKNIVPMPIIEPQILQPVAQELHRLSNSSSQICCNTSLSHSGFPDNVLLQLILFHLGYQFYSFLCYMSCLCHVWFCHVIISSLLYVAYPYTKKSQCLLTTSCFYMNAKPTLNCL
jgi:hypothetical protein